MSKESIDNLETIVDSIEKDYRNGKNISITLLSTLMTIKTARTNEHNKPYEDTLTALESRLEKLRS